jgi:hypothetical protein
MADIAAIFHWPLSELDAMTIDELCTWRQCAANRSGNQE